MLKTIVRKGVRSVDKLIGRNTVTTADKLAMRVYAKVTESLLSKPSIENSSHADWLKGTIESSQLFYQAFLLYRSEDDFDHLTKQAMRIAEKYERFEVLTEMYQWKRHRKAVKSGVKSAEKWHIKMLNSAAATRAIRNAFYESECFFANTALNKGVNTRELKALKKKIDKMNNDYEGSKSSRLLYYIEKLTVEYHLGCGKFQESESASLRLAELIKSSPAIYGNTKMVITYSDLADNMMVGRMYAKAIHYCDLALIYKEFISKFTHTNILFTTVYCHFYSRDFDRVEITLLQIEALSPTPFDQDRIAYYRAYIDHCNGDYKKSIEKLTGITEFKEDSEGWFLASKMLEIQNFMHVDQDYCDSAIHAMRIFVRRHSSNMSDRFKFISKQFSKLRTKAYNFETTAIELNECPPWQPKTPELLPFEEWYHNMKQSA